MSRLRFDLMFLGLAFAALAYVLLSAWSLRNAPLWVRFERAWAADVAALEASGKLPAAWADVRELELIGGTPESRAWLKRIKIPLRTNPRGQSRMDVLVVAWDEAGKRGALVQYNIEDLKTKNMRAEIARTLILTTPASGLEALPWLPR